MCVEDLCVRIELLRARYAQLLVVAWRNRAFLRLYIATMLVRALSEDWEYHWFRELSHLRVKNFLCRVDFFSLASSQFYFWPRFSWKHLQKSFNYARVSCSSLLVRVERLRTCSGIYWCISRSPYWALLEAQCKGFQPFSDSELSVFKYDV